MFNVRGGEPTVWIVIVNYQSEVLVCKCLDSLRRHVQHPYNIVVVDNSMPAETSNIAKSHTDTVIIEAESNGGFAAGCNLGIEYCQKNSAEFILLLNPDTYVEQDFISNMITAFKSNPKLGMAGPTIYFAEPKNKLWMAGTKLNWWTGGPKHIYDDHLKNTNQVTYVPFISGCAMMLRGTAAQQIGLMEEKYFLYFEDADYCQKMIKHGWEIAYIPTAEVIHAASSTTGYQSENYVYYFSRNRIWFLYRWAPSIAFFYYLLFTLLIKIPGSIVIFTFLRNKPKLTMAFLKGFRDGVKGLSK